MVPFLLYEIKVRRVDLQRDKASCSVSDNNSSFDEDVLKTLGIKKTSRTKGFLLQN